jgi:L-seryl-tRNA(Ser) seleniumtransferase
MNELSFQPGGEFAPEYAPEPTPESASETALTLQTLPSVDRLLSTASAQHSAQQHGRTLVKRAIVSALSAMRQRLAASASAAAADTTNGEACTLDYLQRAIAQQLADQLKPNLRAVFNLTGTVIHTNLGRSALPEAAISAMVTAARSPVTIEYDLAKGGRGERDDIIERLLCEITGAEAATVVNNNAAAVLLTLTALAKGKEVPVSRGELVEIGGSFRIPDIMQAAGCKLVEVGTTNRTHLVDFENAINKRTGLLARIHTSNFEVVGFTTSPSEADLATLAHARGIPLMVDLGSGALVPFERYGLPHEPLPQDTMKAGADVVTFSGDKLLGGPQSGIITGNKALIAQIRRHPLKRALRCDKLIIGALEGVLRTYRDHLDDPQQLAEHLPVLRLLSRPQAAIKQVGERLLASLQHALRASAEVALHPTLSQIGSGSLPIARLDSWALVINPLGKRSGRTVHVLEAALRQLPMPVIGRINDGAIWLDLRTLENESGFTAQLGMLSEPSQPGHPSHLLTPAP